MRRIDLSGCPPDFQKAFRDHIQAWAEMESLTLTNSGFNIVFKSALTFGAAAGDAYFRIDSAEQRITSTWHEVLRIAGQYGAEIPESG